MKKYRIEKILSNNAIVVLDDQKQEMIALGSGVGFGKRPGAHVSDDQFEKVFSHHGDDLYKKLFVTLSHSSSDMIAIVDQAVKYAKEDLSRDLNEYIYVLLTDHLNFAVERMKQNIVLPCPMISEIRCLYQKEYKVAAKVVEDIAHQMHIHLPDSEIGFIALHIMNASTGEGKINDVLNKVSIVNEIVQLIENYFKLQFDKESLNYLRLLIHLDFFAKRIIEKFDLPEETEILDLFQQKYKNQKECVEMIAQYLKTEYDYVTSDSEKVYLVIHLSRCLNN